MSELVRSRACGQEPLKSQIRREKIHIHWIRIVKTVFFLDCSFIFGVSICKTFVMFTCYFQFSPPPSPLRIQLHFIVPYFNVPPKNEILYSCPTLSFHLKYIILYSNLSLHKGWMPHSLRDIYSQDIPKGRPGTFQQDVLQCFIFAFSPDICAPYAYIWTVNRCPTVVTV